MKEYGMFYVKSPEHVFKTRQKSLNEAINYFAKIKDLPRDKFLQLFVVEEIKK